MANTSLIFHNLAQHRLSFKTFFFIPTALALITTLFVLFYVSSSTSHLLYFSHHHPHILYVSPKNPLTGSPSFPVSDHNVSKHHHPFVDLSNRSGGGGGGGRSVSQRNAIVDLGSNEAFQKHFLIIPTSLALVTFFFILSYVSRTSKLFPIISHEYNITLESLIGISSFSTITQMTIPVPLQNDSKKLFFGLPETGKLTEEKHPSQQLRYSGLNGNYRNNKEVFHDRDIFLEDYKWMNRSFRIYIYPHNRTDPFADVLLPVDFEPGGNYASENYFKKVLAKSHLITKDPAKADLFFLPFSIVRMRYDPIIGMSGMQDFIRDYIVNISQKYPYWNRTNGADHFYVNCHSVGKFAMQKAWNVKLNAIQVVCSSSYFVLGYIAHKDASIPQIWPRQSEPPNLVSSKRKKLAFFAGAINNPARVRLLQFWRNDSEIFAHYGRLKTPYADELLGSKFCLHVKGFEVNTARIADSLYYGCVPVIIADHYDLPFADILNWKSFSVVVTTSDIPLLKKILKGISFDEYLLLRQNVLKVRKHFQWHLSPVGYDAFYMVMYELWLRRNSMRLELSPSIDSG